MNNKELAIDTQNGISQSRKSYNIFVAHKGYYINLKPEDIHWVSSEGNYAHIHTREKQYVNRISLTGLLKLLPPHQFIKIHKCYLVQINAITHIDKANNEVRINDQSIPIGRSYKTRLFNSLQLIN